MPAAKKRPRSTTAEPTAPQLRAAIQQAHRAGDYGQVRRLCRQQLALAPGGEAGRAARAQLQALRPDRLAWQCGLLALVLVGLAWALVWQG